MYEAFRSMRNDENIWDTLSEAQKRIVSASLKEAELGGVGLEGEKKERFNQIEEELSKLSTDFGKYVKMNLYRFLFRLFPLSLSLCVCVCVLFPCIHVRLYLMTCLIIRR